MVNKQMTDAAIRLLIVDDNDADRANVRFLLEGKRAPGYVVEEVDYGRLAADACERFQPDCVLLDFRLPDMDGLEVLAELRARFGELKFAVVLAAGAGHELLAVSAMKGGAQDYIPKRALNEELLDRVIGNALDKLRMERRRQQMEEALAADDFKLRNIIDTAPCALYTVDLVEQRSVYIGGSIEGLIGYTPEEIDDLRATGLLDLIHPQDRAAVQAHTKQLRLALKPHTLQCEFRIMHKDRTWRWISLHNRVVERDENGLGVLAAGAASDISPRKQIESELEESQFQLVMAQEAAGIGTWVVGLGNDQVICSPLCLGLYGRAQGRASSAQLWGEWVHPEDRERVSAEITRGMDGAPFETEFRVVWPDQSIHWLRSQGKLVEEAGRANRFVGASLNITEKKASEEELKRSNDELERFAYVASHDLQEPLRTILSFSELFARRNKTEDPESKQFLAYVREGGQRMQALITDLLTFSRVTQVGHEPLEEVDSNGPLEEALSGLQALITETAAKVEAAPLPVVTANFQQLAQVFQNLVGNALKYRSKRPPVVRISAARTGRVWQFCVADNGIGFEMEYAERIFDAFKRLHTRDQYSGTGLGLALCKRIVERHGGRIWAESELGVGSSFFFTIAA